MSFTVPTRSSAGLQQRTGHPWHDLEVRIHMVHLCYKNERSGDHTSCLPKEMALRRTHARRAEDFQ